MKNLITFVVCWAPLIFVHLVMGSFYIHYLFWRVAVILAELNAAINPIIYICNTSGSSSFNFHGGILDLFATNLSIWTFQLQYFNYNLMTDSRRAEDLDIIWKLYHPVLFLWYLSSSHLPNLFLNFILIYICIYYYYDSSKSWLLK